MVRFRSSRLKGSRFKGSRFKKSRFNSSGLKGSRFKTMYDHLRNSEIGHTIIEKMIEHISKKYQKNNRKNNETFENQQTQIPGRRISKLVYMATDYSARCVCVRVCARAIFHRGQKHFPENEILGVAKNMILAFKNQVFKSQLAQNASVRPKRLPGRSWPKMIPKRHKP